jgi:hypothetical protein
MNDNDRPEQDGCLPVERIADIAPEESPRRWLIEDLWGAASVGFLAGTPKVGKSWLGLDMALSVASATRCLGRFRVLDPGPSLVYLAEDSLQALRQRVSALARHRELSLSGLDLHVITAPILRLDDGRDRRRLFNTVGALRPRLLLLDPLVRMHRLNENDSREVSGLLSHLRELQRLYDVAILLVHHTRKGGASEDGESLRGSIDFWAWSDSNLYLKRRDGHLRLAMEHRSAAALEPIALRLVDTDELTTHLEVTGASEETPPLQRPLTALVLDLLRDAGPLSRTKLRERLRVKNARLGEALKALEAERRIARHDGGLWVIRSGA